MTQTFEIDQFPCLSDNYGYLIHNKNHNLTAAIDTPDADAIRDRLKEKGWSLTHILNTHHHPDHIGGNISLQEETGCKIIAPAGEVDKIPGATKTVEQGDMICFGDIYIEVLNVGGHTMGHIAYFIRSETCAFVGDALFALGCGRLFEGTAHQMWRSLNRLNRLPKETMIYCAHEYTKANAEFALTIDPDNTQLQKRYQEILAKREHGEPTIPTRLDIEQATNPFLRVHDMDIRARLNLIHASDSDVFAEIRQRKDSF